MFSNKMDARAFTGSLATSTLPAGRAALAAVVFPPGAAHRSSIATGSVSYTHLGSVEQVGFHKALKTKFIEGNAGFMSLVALALVLGLAFCIERIIYLSLSEINAKKFMADLDDKICLLYTSQACHQA